jgi:hypothetical protein
MFVTGRISSPVRGRFIPAGATFVMLLVIAMVGIQHTR